MFIYGIYTSGYSFIAYAYFNIDKNNITKNAKKRNFIDLININIAGNKIIS